MKLFSWKLFRNLPQDDPETTAEETVDAAVLEKHPSTDIPESENNLADMYTLEKDVSLSGKNYENVPKAINNTELYENAENNRLNTEVQWEYTQLGIYWNPLYNLCSRVWAQLSLMSYMRLKILTGRNLRQDQALGGAAKWREGFEGRRTGQKESRSCMNQLSGTN